MAGEVILVIEDDVHIGGLVVQVLREAGFAPALVRDVRAAREWAQEGNKPAAGGEAAAPLAVAIGNFDGVHLGHGALLAEVRARAARLGAQSAVLTFTPHPARLFAPDRAPPLIMSLERRLELIAAAGIDVA